MRLLRTSVHPSLDDITTGVYLRRAARAIVTRGNDVLLLYTERYDDYTLPGGGVDDGEDLVSGMVRELREETGATDVRDVSEFGLYVEYRPWEKPGYRVMRMESYCFRCTVDGPLGATKLEGYEQRNGMTPRWVNIDTAIAHNERTLASSPKQGVSIERETFLLNRIVAER